MNKKLLYYGLFLPFINGVMSFEPLSFGSQPDLIRISTTSEQLHVTAYFFSNDY